MITRSYKNSHREKPNINQEIWCKECKGLSSLRTMRTSYSPESPLDSTAIKPITRSPNKLLETGKMENLSRSYLWLVHSTWARWWRSRPPQDGTPFLISFAWWRLANCSPILHYGKASFRSIFTCPLTNNGWQASSMWSSRFHLELALLKLNDDQHLMSSTHGL